MKKVILFLLALSLAIYSYAQEIDTLVWADYSEMYSITSDDGELRLLTFKTKNKKLQYIHELRYQVTPNVVRSSSLQDHRFLALPKHYKSLIINKIHFVKDGNYLLEGIDQGHQYVLMAIDIRRGIALNAYLLPLEEEKLTNLITFSFDTTRYATEEVRVEILEERLRLPNSQDGEFNGEFINYYFNGMHYEDSLSYANTVQQTQEGEEIITRIHFKDEDNRCILDALYPEIPHSVAIVIAPTGGTYGEYVDLRLQNDSKGHHFKQKKYDVSMPLRVLNGMVFVENLDSYHLPIVKSKKGKLKSVVYSAGRKWAIPYEWLRYSAVIFNRPIKKEEYTLVHWALEIDGELQYLEGEEWYGTQIDLQMKEEWLGKTLKVLPYIEGEAIDEKVAIETKVIPYKINIASLGF